MDFRKLVIGKEDSPNEVSNLTILSISSFFGLTNKVASSVYIEILIVGEQLPDLLGTPVSVAIFRIFSVVSQSPEQKGGGRRRRVTLLETSPMTFC